MAETTNTVSGAVETKTGSYFKENRKSLAIIGGAIVLIVGGYISYLYFYKQPREEKAMASMWKAEYFFEKDSFNLAIKGGDGMQGFLKLSKNYSGTMGGNIASYCLGISYLNLGEYKKAITALEEVSFDDEIVSSMTIGAIGDAYAELNKMDEAIEKYEEAANNTENNFTTPMYLKKAAMLYETKKNYKEAVKLYERISNDYKEAIGYADIDKYLTRARSLVK